MTTTYIIFFTICFVCYAMRTVFNVLKIKKNPLAENKKIVIAVYAVMAVLWF